MHELAIAESICAIVVEAAEGRRVTRVVVHVGVLSAVLPDALRFSFEVATRETVLESAELVLVDAPASARCRACNAVTELSHPSSRCACGSVDLEWLSGTELKVLEMEVVDDVRDVRVR